MGFRRVVFGLCALFLAASTAYALPDPRVIEKLAQDMPRKSVVLLGEAHDNPHHHAVRLEALRLAVEAGWRPALALEQFDRERQPDIERARRERPNDADHVIAQATPLNSGWNWSFYRPFVELALHYDLPLLAANLSRSDAGRVMREGFAAVLKPDWLEASGLDRGLPEDIRIVQMSEIKRGHCDRLPAESLPGMVRAQIARDVYMAVVLREHAWQGVVLLAGNGHVRKDIGVPRWLGDIAPGKVLTVGLVETGTQGEAVVDAPEAMPRYDRMVTTPAVERTDPCAAWPAAQP